MRTKVSGWAMLEYASLPTKNFTYLDVFAIITLCRFVIGVLAILSGLRLFGFVTLSSLARFSIL
jgi:hypothetical protein